MVPKLLTGLTLPRIPIKMEKAQKQHVFLPNCSLITEKERRKNGRITRQIRLVQKNGGITLAKKILKEKRRIYGLEIEYGFVFMGSRDSSKEDVHFVEDRDPAMPLTAEGWLFKALNEIAKIDYQRFHSDAVKDYIDHFFSRTGGRIYLDCGSHPEIATPECLTFKEVVLHDKAGERIMERALKKVNERLRARFEELKRENYSAKFQELLLFKNNTHSGSETFGCHENYSYFVKTNFLDEIAPWLMPFLVTRQIFCGAGKLWKNRYEISQRARFINEEMSPYSSGNSGEPRPIINSRTQDGDGSHDNNDGALADSRFWNRLHLILGDSNMSEYTTWLKLGTTALVLRMIEDGFFSWRMKIRNAVAAYHQVSRDLTCREKIAVVFARRDNPLAAKHLNLNPVEIQKLYLKQARKYLKERKSRLTEKNLREFRKIVAEWSKVLKKLEINPKLLKREIDWVIKKDLLDRYQERQNIDLNSSILRMIDVQYHSIERDKGLYYLLEKEGKVRRILTDGEIELAETRPPQDTRAKWRAEIIDLCERRKMFYVADWNQIFIRSNSKECLRAATIRCLDPFCVKPTKIKKIMEKRIIRRS